MNISFRYEIQKAYVIVNGDSRHSLRSDFLSDVWEDRLASADDPSGNPLANIKSALGNTDPTGVSEVDENYLVTHAAEKSGWNVQLYEYSLDPLSASGSMEIQWI